MNRRLLCEAVKGIVYEERCLLKLAKMVDDDKTCVQCILFENLQLRKKLNELKQEWERKIHRLKKERGKRLP